MTTRMLILLLCWLGASGFSDAFGQTVQRERQQVDFETEVVPILTRYGCNSGACHGAASGRGNFRLSLFGSRPQDDFQAIVHHLEGRRIHRVRAEQSLFLQKPTGAVDHQGGLRFSESELPYQILLRWINEGASGKRSRVLQRLHVSVESVRDETANPVRRLRVLGAFDSGTSNVTELTTFSPEDPSGVRVDHAGIVEVLRHGRHVIIARYLNQVVPIEVLEPEIHVKLESTESLAAPSQVIDVLIRNRLRTMDVTPAPLVDPPAWLRRISLDLTGRLPSDPDAGTSIDLADAATISSFDREAIIDRLLASQAFAEFWSFRLSRMLQLDSVGNFDAAAAARNWLRTQLEEETSLAEMVRSLLTAEGNPALYGPAAFYLVRNDARGQAEYVSETFAGIRLRCANCHDHPLDRWTQDDYHGLAAVFADVSRGDQIRRLGRGSVIHPGTGLPAVRSIPGMRTELGATEQTGSAIGCREIADWLLDPDDAVFARNFVNRIWYVLTGRGLVHPVDDLRITNTAIHSEVLDRLTSDFVKSDYQLRPLIRTICLTETYARADSNLKKLQSVPGLFAESQRKPLMAEVLLDAICDVTGVPEHYEGHESGTRAIQLNSARIETESLRLLRQTEPDTTTVLGLLNGPILNEKLADPNSVISKLMQDPGTIENLIHRIYVRILLRQPTTAELLLWKQQFEVSGLADGARLKEDAARTFVEDLAWSLMVSPEFIY